MAARSAKNEIPADMWLHVATDALVRWAAADENGDLLAYEERDDLGPTLVIVLRGVTFDDPRLCPSFHVGEMGKE